MEPCILLKWNRMEEHLNTQLTRLVLNTELDIAMLNALKISSLFGVRPTVRIGKTIKDFMDPAAQNLTFGRQTNKPTHTPLILAEFLDTIVVKELIVDKELIDRKVHVIKMVVTSIPSEMEIKISMVLDLSTALILPNL